ncbi:MAG: V4R domain-containing protein [Myxococcota bacterium]|nr:V4R domain-containing protein [Myxococcota bacterium]
MNPPYDESPELATLAAVGFGPETTLMTEPKLFVDARLLAALIVELEDELGSDAAARTLFQIGLIHGLRDADEAISRGFLTETNAPISQSSLSPPIVIDIDAPRGTTRDGWCVPGRWPEQYEANAWLSKLGPSDRPSCWLSSGYTSGWLSGTLDADVLVLEDSCAGCGDAGCAFTAREPAAWDELPRNNARETLGTIDFGLYRALALRCPTGPPQAMVETQGDFDADAALVHIWGPVMVLPFTSADETLRTTEALSRDSSIGEIRCVVIDLRNRVIDDSFDSAAIERVLETVEAWGAEPILTGINPMAADIVEGLESRHLLVRKDLSEAIAAAFLIAQAQRYTA